MCNNLVTSTCLKAAVYALHLLVIETSLFTYLWVTCGSNSVGTSRKTSRNSLPSVCNPIFHI